MTKPKTDFQNDPKGAVMRYVDERLNNWAKWAREKVKLGVGYHSQSVEYRLITEGLLVREPGAKRPMPCDPKAEEVEELLMYMSQQCRVMADTVREMYLTDDRIENKSRRTCVSETVFKTYLAMGRWWLASRLTLKWKSKGKLKK
jgi:hypothetical protein